MCSNAFLTADLVRSIHPVPDNLEMDFLRISSYVGTQSSGHGTLSTQSRLSVKGRHVLVVSNVHCAVAQPISLVCPYTSCFGVMHAAATHESMHGCKC